MSANSPRLIGLLLAAGAACYCFAQAPERMPNMVRGSQPVEYRLVPLTEFGVRSAGAGAIFNYDAGSKKLNELAAEGWRYRDQIVGRENAATMTALLFERAR